MIRQTMVIGEVGERGFLLREQGKETPQNVPRTCGMFSEFLHTRDVTWLVCTEAPREHRVGDEDPDTPRAPAGSPEQLQGSWAAPTHITTVTERLWVGKDSRNHRPPPF